MVGLITLGHEKKMPKDEILALLFVPVSLALAVFIIVFLVIFQPKQFLEAYLDSKK